MVYALLYAENADVVGICPSREEAQRKLAALVRHHPELRDQIGMCAYDHGHPVGEFTSAR